jgi:biopolymer transport protein ExbD
MGFRKKGAGFEGAELSMAITPMLDLAFQLLAFFIITYHPSQLQEGQMTLNLPDAAQTQAANPKEAQADTSLPGDIPLPS